MEKFKVTIIKKDNTIIEKLIKESNPGQALHAVMFNNSVTFSELKSIYVSNINI